MSRAKRLLQVLLGFAGFVSPAANFVGLVALAALNIADANGQITYGPVDHVGRVVVFTVGVGVLAVSGVIGVAARWKAGQVQAENGRLRSLAAEAEVALAEVRAHEMRLLANRFAYYTDERISLFLHVAGAFYLVARTSDDPDFAHMNNGPYDERLGCLGRAWAKERDHLTLPPKAREPAGWYSAQKTRGLTKQMAESLTMATRTYNAYRIQTASGLMLGVVVFESEHASDEGTAVGAVVLGSDELLEKMKTEHWGKRLEALLLATARLRSTKES